MENKGLKKSTMQQLRTLVMHMEENPELARGTPVFGASKISAEEEWKKLCNNLNAFGPPKRSIAEWKKSWADLKSRTKKKLADNAKSLKETGGGLYRYSNLTELETIIDRTLLLSSAAAPSGAVFGCETQSIDDCFIPLVESPARCSKTIAVVTPNRIANAVEESLPQLNAQQLPKKKQDISASKRQPNILSDSDSEQPTCHSAKKRKIVDEQLSLIRRQIRVAERNAIAARDQANFLQRMAEYAEVQADAAKRAADAAEVQAEASKKIAAAEEATAANIKDIKSILESYVSKNIL